MNDTTRERWLRDLAEAVTPIFADADATVPEFAVSVGWPSRGALAKKKRVIGQAWTPKASRAGRSEVFISPYLDDPLTVASTLIHEMVHVVVGIDAGHRAPFKRLAVAVGLEGKMTSTVPGADLTARLTDILATLDPFPHGSLDGLTDGKKKQSTRLLKVACGSCGYVVRMTKRWVEVAVPVCPNPDCMSCGEDMEVDLPDGEE